MAKEKNSSKEVKSVRVKKKLEDLGFWDNFIFTRVMLDRKICVEITSALLGYDVDDLEYHETEKTLDVAYDSKSVRFDCFVKSENKIINIEMQVNDDKQIIFRARYYHIIIGMDNLSSGEDYTELPDTYVIFICKYDPFNKGYVKYQFESYDKENDVLENNKAHTIYFNTSAIDSLEECKLKEILKLAEGIESDDEFALRVKQKIIEIKSNVKWQKDYMKYSADMMDEKRAGKAEGIEQNKLENAKNLLDVLDDETIETKIGLDIEVVKELRKENS